MTTPAICGCWGHVRSSRVCAQGGKGEMEEGNEGRREERREMEGVMEGRREEGRRITDTFSTTEGGRDGGAV